ncbi:MAG: gliding motility-associated C-terminal domain-containing protein, partial [Bacteroidales bacterium]|nr:gliding motility-associated C-terminal domain-containing protein [Bacteroidales bacterium]
YNRWGTLIFHTTDLHTGWTGENAKSGVYTYYIEYLLMGSNKRELHREGSVTLIEK